MLLDIQMPELDGFDVLQSLEMPRLPEIIFVSAFDQYALRAFQVHALDYVLKPVEADRLSEALDHARVRLRDRRSAGDAGLEGLLRELTKDRPYLTRVPVRSENRVRVVDLADVDWVGAADNYVALHCRQPRVSRARHDRAVSGPASIRSISSASIARPSCASIASTSWSPMAMATSKCG